MRCEDTETGKTGISYADYLQLDKVLKAQRPLSQDRNELLFIIQHQTTELWMKLILHELGDAIAHIRSDTLPPAFKMLARVSRIMEQLVKAWDVLSTMTPSEYSAIRPALGTASGIQSWQYRAIEYRLGNKNIDTLDQHRGDEAQFAKLERALHAPSIYDEALALLDRRGFAIPHAALDREKTAATQYDPDVEAAWLAVYRDPAKHWDLYELGEELVDLEDAFRLWRFRHVTTVERIIGFKRGTGGTEGASYLRRMLDVVLFPELWRLRTSM